MYIATSFTWFMIGGLMALFMRAELARPGMQFLSPEQYNQLFTMHGTIMLLFYATAVVFGFANFVLPLQIGAPDVAFPRLNAFSYWLYFFGAIISTSGFFTPNGAAAFGWTAYPPLSSVEHSPGVGGDLWIMGLAVSGLGTILGGVNMITTIICMRAPGMTMWRMPIFTWGILVTSILILVAFPILTAALFGLAADRHFGSHGLGAFQRGGGEFGQPGQPFARQHWGGLRLSDGIGGAAGGVGSAGFRHVHLPAIGCSRSSARRTDTGAEAIRDVAGNRPTWGG